MTEREALKLALDAFGEIAWSNETQWQRDRAKEAIVGIKEALAQPEQEPAATIAVRWHEPVGKVAFVLEVDLPVGIHKVYTAPPHRRWVGLTDEEVNTIYEQAEVLVHDSWVGNGTVGLMFPITLYKMFEAKLKEKNT